MSSSDGYTATGPGDRGFTTDYQNGSFKIGVVAEGLEAGVSASSEAIAVKAVGTGTGIGLVATGKTGVDAKGNDVAVKAEGVAGGGTGILATGKTGVDAWGTKVAVQAHGPSAGTGVHATGKTAVEAIGGKVGVQGEGGGVGVHGEGGDVGVHGGGPVGVRGSGSVGVEARGNVGVDVIAGSVGVRVGQQPLDPRTTPPDIGIKVAASQIGVEADGGTDRTNSIGVAGSGAAFGVSGSSDSVGVVGRGAIGVQAHGTWTPSVPYPVAVMATADLPGVPLVLAPGGATPPTAAPRGAFWVETANPSGGLWFCVQDGDGSPGKLAVWKQVALI